MGRKALEAMKIKFDVLQNYNGKWFSVDIVGGFDVKEGVAIMYGNRHQLIVSKDLSKIQFGQTGYHTKVSELKEGVVTWEHADGRVIRWFDERRWQELQRSDT